MILGFFVLISPHRPTLLNVLLSFQVQCNHIASTHTESLSALASRNSDFQRLDLGDSENSSVTLSTKDAALQRVKYRLVPSKVTEIIKKLEENALLSIDCLNHKKACEYLRGLGICETDVSDLTITDHEWSRTWRDRLIQNLPSHCQLPAVIESTLKAMGAVQTRDEFVEKVISKSITVLPGVRMYIEEQFPAPIAVARSVRHESGLALIGNSTSDNAGPFISDEARALTGGERTPDRHAPIGHSSDIISSSTYQNSFESEQGVDEAEKVVREAIDQMMEMNKNDANVTVPVCIEQFSTIPSTDAEMSAEIDEIGLSVADRVKIQIFKNHCLSCSQPCLRGEFVQCQGCQAPIHDQCLRSITHNSLKFFVCLLCRHYNTDLNKRVMDLFSGQKQKKRSRITKSPRVCSECYSDILPNDTVLCLFCGTYYCATGCAILGLQASSDEEFKQPRDWKCRWCLGREEYRNQLLQTLRPLSESALLISANMSSHENLDGQKFAQMFFDVWNHRDQNLIDEFKGSYVQLVKLENIKANKILGYLQCFTPSQLIEFSFTSEAEAFSAANAHAKSYYQKAPDQIVRNIQATNATTERKKGAVVTSDCTMHPTWQMSQNVLEHLHLDHFELFFYLLGNPEPSRLDALYKSVGADNVFILNDKSDPEAAQLILERYPFFVLYLDGHTGTRPGLWGSVEKMVEVSKLKVHLLVFNAYAGVFGGSSKTIVDKFVAKDRTLYESSSLNSAGTVPFSKTCCIRNSYHLTRTVENETISGRLLKAQAEGHTMTSHGFEDKDLVLGFPGRLARFNVETQKCFFEIKKRVGEQFKLYLNVNNSPFDTVLNIQDSLIRIGFKASDIKFVQSLPPDEDEKRMRSVLTVFGNAVCGYGLHSSASNALRNGIVGVTIVGNTFVESVMTSILSSIHLGDLCVADESKYKDKVCQLLTDTSYREEIKSNLEPPALRQTSVFNSELGASDLAELINSLQIDAGISAADQPITLAGLPAAIPANVSQLTASDEFSFWIEDWCAGSKVVGFFMNCGNLETYQGKIVKRNTDSTKFDSISVLYNDGEEHSYTVADLMDDSELLEYHHQSNSDEIQSVNEMLYLLRLLPVDVDSEKERADQFRLSPSVGEKPWKNQVTIVLKKILLMKSMYSSDGSSSWFTKCETFLRLQPLSSGACDAAHTLLALNAGVSSSNQKECRLHTILMEYSRSQDLGVTETELKEIIQKICDAVHRKASSVHWMGVLGEGGFGIVIHGKAVIRGMGNEHQNFVAKFEIDKCDSETSAIRRELNISREYNQLRKPNNCIPSTVGLFQGIHHYGEVKVDGITARTMVMEKLEPYLQPLRNQTQDLFLSEGRLLPEWRIGCRDALDSVLFLHTNDIAHLDLKPEHFMKNSENKVMVVDFGLSQTSKNDYQHRPRNQKKTKRFKAADQELKTPNMSFVQKIQYNSMRKPMLDILGFGTPGYKAPEIVREGCTTIQDRKQHDLWSLGIIFMEAVCKLPQETKERNLFEKDLFKAVSERNFKTFLDFIIKPNPEGSPAHITLSNAARIADGEQAHETGNAEQDRIMQVRAGFVLELLRLAFEFLNPAADERISIAQAFVSGFITDYQPISLEEEHELINKGKMVEGKVNPDGENQNPCVILLIPGQGLHTLSLLTTKAGAPVGGYGGVHSCLTTRDSADSAERFSLHVLPAAGMQIDGSPGINVTLDNLAKSGCPGSLFASSRVHPSAPKEGNVCNPQCPRGNLLSTRLDDGTVIYSYPMNARIDLTVGISLNWCYNWAAICGGCGLSVPLINSRKEAFSKGIPDYAQKIVQQRREEVLAAGIFSDFIPYLGSTEASMPDGGGELAGPVSRNTIQKNPGQNPNAVRKAREPIDMIHSLFKTVSGGGADGGSEGLSGSVCAKGYTMIFRHLGVDRKMVVDFGAGDGRMLLAAIAAGASEAIGYELPGNASRKYLFDAVQKRLKENFPEGFLWDKAEWIGRSIDEVISLLIGPPLIHVSVSFNEPL